MISYLRVIVSATSKAMAAIEDLMLQTLGRWHNATFLCYIRILQDHQTAVTISFANSN